MSYKYTHFAGLDLPTGMTDEDVGTPTVDTSLIESIGGSFDYYGSLQRYPRKHVIPYKGMYSGSLSYVDSKIAALYTLLGGYGQLTRNRIYNNTNHTKYARLVSIKQPRGIELAGVPAAELELVFESAEKAWRGATQTNTGSLSAGTTARSLDNNGNFVADDVIVTVIPSGTLTALRIYTAGGADWSYTANVTAGQILVIDCGRKLVRVDGVNKYQYFALASGHSVRDWLPLEPGTTTVNVVLTGAGASVTFSWYDKWM